MATITTQDIETMVGNAKNYALEQGAAILANLKKGCEVGVASQTSLIAAITAMQMQLDAQVIDDNTISLYKCLKQVIGGYNVPFVVDPNVQIPGQEVIVVTQVVGFKSAKIPFATTNENPTVVLNDYHNQYYPLYGNNPSLALYNDQGQFIGDEATPPVITYQDDNPTLDILSIEWQYPVATVGYIQIAGITPNSSTTASGAIGGGGSSGGGGNVTGKSGIFTATGNGILTTITIPHGFTGVSGLSKLFITPIMDGFDTEDYESASCDPTNVYINYDVAPPAPSTPGVPNLKYNIFII